METGRRLEGLGAKKEVFQYFDVYHHKGGALAAIFFISGAGDEVRTRSAWFFEISKHQLIICQLIGFAVEME